MIGIQGSDRGNDEESGGEDGAGAGLDNRFNFKGLSVPHRRLQEETGLSVTQTQARWAFRCEQWLVGVSVSLRRRSWLGLTRFY